MHSTHSQEHATMTIFGSLLFTSKSNQLIFGRNCSEILNSVKFSSAVYNKLLVYDCAICNYARTAQEQNASSTIQMAANA